MPAAIGACFGLRSPWGELLGVVVFGWTPSPQSHNLCGEEHRDLAICLARGATVHWSPPNAASYLIAQALKQATKTYGWRIYFAYADPEAGEWGGVYEACSWLYTGDTEAIEDYVMPDGKVVTKRGLRKVGLTKADVIAVGAEVLKRSPKRRYVTFTGSAVNDKRRLRKLLKYEVLPYPT